MKIIKIKLILFVIFITDCTASFAAFSLIENNQLENINAKTNDEVKFALDNLDRAVDLQIRNNPEYEPLIIDLKKSWGIMIEKKCQLECIDSKGTDAETAEINNCLVRYYLEETSYFKMMLP